MFIRLTSIWDITKALLTQFFKAEEVINGVETMKMEGGEQDEVKQPRVTKAQKRRVSYRIPLK